MTNFIYKLEQNAGKTKQQPKQAGRGKNLKVGIYGSFNYTG